MEGTEAAGLVLGFWDMITQWWVLLLIGIYLTFVWLYSEE